MIDESNAELDRMTAIPLPEEVEGVDLGELLASLPDDPIGDLGALIASLDTELSELLAEFSHKLDDAVWQLNSEREAGWSAPVAAVARATCDRMAAVKQKLVTTANAIDGAYVGALLNATHRKAVAGRKAA